MRLRHVAIALVSLLLVLVLLVGAGLLWAMNLDFRALAEQKGSEALGRSVTVGAVEIGWGDPLHLEIRDLKIANMQGGSRPEMVSVDHIDALIDVRPLLSGTLRYRHLAVTKLDILLERDAQGKGNWKFAGGSGGTGGLAIVPKDRTQFPTLLDFALQDSTIAYVTSSKKHLTVALKQATIASTGDDQPVSITAEGAYNDLPITVKGTTDSFETMRDASAPFHEDFTVTNKDSTIGFNGHLMNPLDFDQVDAALAIDTKDFGQLLKAFDAGVAADFPVKLAGHFTHAGNHWQIDDVDGAVADNPVTGRFVLDEGPRGGTDRMAVKARYDMLVLDRILGKSKDKKSTDWKAIELQLPDKTAMDVTFDIAANRLRYGKTALSKVALIGRAAPGLLDLDTAKFALAGSTFQASATAKAEGKATRLHIDAGLPGANLNDLLKTLESDTDQIAGQISARVTLDATGAKLGEALAQSQGAAVFAMIDGKVARDLLQKASVDLRTLFRKGEGMSPVKCLLGVAAINNGVATIAPLVLRTPDATLAGGGTVDLRRSTVDLTIRSDPKSTGFFALDIPIRISGPLDAPKAGPDSKSKFKASTGLPELPAEIRKVAEQSGCLAG